VNTEMKNTNSAIIENRRLVAQGACAVCVVKMLRSGKTQANSAIG